MWEKGRKENRIMSTVWRENMSEEGVRCGGEAGSGAQNKAPREQKCTMTVI